MEIIRITKFGDNFLPNPEQFDDLRMLIELCDDLYPGIEAWYTTKVLSGLKTNQRSAYIIYENERPVGASILKRGTNAKICSFRILPEAEKKGYGRLLMASLALDMWQEARTFHYTIPAHIWDFHQKFFREYGFSCKELAEEQYRIFDDELFGVGSVLKMWKRVIETLPDIVKNVSINGIRSTYDLVMSLQPNFANLVFDGTKQVEIRRKFSTKWQGSNVLVYSSRPVQCFVGAFIISEVVEGHPKDIWETYSDRIGCSHSEFSNYTFGADRIFAIIVGDKQEFKAPIPKRHISQLATKDLSVPQSYSKVYENDALSEAASISTLLQTI